jgi:hypothetical protein
VRFIFVMVVLVCDYVKELKRDKTEEKSTSEREPGQEAGTEGRQV